MHPYTDLIDLQVTETTVIPADVVSSEAIDGVYFYTLYATFGDGNNAQTVTLTNVHESLVTGKI